MEINILAEKDRTPSIKRIHTILHGETFKAKQVAQAHGWELRFQHVTCIYCSVALDENQRLALSMNGIQPILEPTGAQDHDEKGL